MDQYLSQIHGYNSNLIHHIDRIRVNVIFNFEVGDFGQDHLVQQILDKITQDWGEINDE